MCLFGEKGIDLDERPFDDQIVFPLRHPQPLGVVEVDKLCHDAQLGFFAWVDAERAPRELEVQVQLLVLQRDQGERRLLREKRQLDVQPFIPAGRVVVRKVHKVTHGNALGRVVVHVVPHEAVLAADRLEGLLSRGDRRLLDQLVAGEDGRLVDDGRVALDLALEIVHVLEEVAAALHAEHEHDFAQHIALARDIAPNDLVVNALCRRAQLRIDELAREGNGASHDLTKRPVRVVVLVHEDVFVAVGDDLEECA